MAPDNWGRRARFGVFIVGSEVVAEAEWWAMAPPGISIHAARVTAPAPWATWNADRSGVKLCDDLDKGAKHFAAMAADVIVVGHSSSSVAGGSGWDDAVTDHLSRRGRRPHAGHHQWRGLHARPVSAGRKPPLRHRPTVVRRYRAFSGDRLSGGAGPEPHWHLPTRARGSVGTRRPAGPLPQFHACRPKRRTPSRSGDC